MKLSFFIFILSIVQISACFTQNKATKTDKSETPEKNSSMEVSGPGFAVIELFTSQGCSSCPPADENLSEVYQDAKKSGAKIYTLAWHVDYWNRLGWKDPFSKAEYSQRQSMYVQALKLQSAYTPQMVVNGETEFVGSNQSRTKELVNKYISIQNSYLLTLAAASTTDGGLRKIPYRIDGNVEGKDILVAIVQNNLMTKVKNGENGGKTLKNDRVVLWFQTINAEDSGTIELPKDFNYLKTGTDIIVFLQDKHSKKIFAANEIIL